MWLCKYNLPHTSCSSAATARLPHTGFKLRLIHPQLNLARFLWKQQISEHNSEGTGEERTAAWLQQQVFQSCGWSSTWKVSAAHHLQSSFPALVRVRPNKWQKGRKCLINKREKEGTNESSVLLVCMTRHNVNTLMSPSVWLCLSTELICATGTTLCHSRSPSPQAAWRSEDKQTPHPTVSTLPQCLVGSIYISTV